MITGISVHDRVDWVFTITGMRTQAQWFRVMPRVRPIFDSALRQVIESA
jgi:hypothetical protein